MKTKKNNLLFPLNLPPFEKGDIVEWSYKHFLNANAFLWKFKRGVFIRFARKRNSEALYCLVHFEGNKYPSKIRVVELKKI